MNAFKIGGLYIFCAALMGVFCSACGVKSHAASAKSLSSAPPQQSMLTCNDPLNPEKSGDGKSGFYCIGSSLVESTSYCLRDSQHDAMHVRKMADPEALLTLTPERKLGSAEIVKLQKPASGACSKQPFTVAGAREGDWFVIVKEENSDDLVLHLFDASTDRKVVDTDEWKTTPSKFDLTLTAGSRWGAKKNQEAGKNKSEFYWQGEKDGVAYFVMLADDRRGKMNQTDAPNVPRIERYYYIEAYTKDSACADERPDRGAHFREWPATSQGDSTCDVRGDLTENGTGSGGHDYP